MRKRIRKQVTCWCDAYPFPHRIKGGYCTGREWVESYHQFDRYACDCCNSNRGNSCEVADGQEALRYCDGFRYDLAKQMGRRHPINPETLVPGFADDPYAEEPTYTDDIPF